MMKNIVAELVLVGLIVIGVLAFAQNMTGACTDAQSKTLSPADQSTLRYSTCDSQSSRRAIGRFGPVV